MMRRGCLVCSPLRFVSVVPMSGSTMVSPTRRRSNRFRGQPSAISNRERRLLRHDGDASSGWSRSDRATMRRHRLCCGQRGAREKAVAWAFGSRCRRQANRCDIETQRVSAENDRRRRNDVHDAALDQPSARPEFYVPVEQTPPALAYMGRSLVLVVRAANPPMRLFS